MSKDIYLPNIYENLSDKIKPRTLWVLGFNYYFLLSDTRLPINLPNEEDLAAILSFIF